MWIVTVRNFIFNLMNSKLSLLKILFFPAGDKKIPLKNKYSSLLILGNGPSLQTLLNQNKKALENKDLLCVNYFGRTEEYIILKPSIYVICSPEYFTEEAKADFALERQRTLNTIAERTTWPMVFCIPAIAKKNTSWNTKFINHPHIKIFYMATTPIEGFSWFEKWAFSSLLGMPRPHNVLIPSIYLGINFGYETIEIAGADHSWLQEIFVDDCNEVLLSQKHFYDKQAAKQNHYRDMAVAQPMYNGGSTQTRKLHEVLEKFYFTFKSYWVLKRFAEAKKVTIVNITPNSYIDAFPKKLLSSNEQSVS